MVDVLAQSFYCSKVVIQELSLVNVCTKTLSKSSWDELIFQKFVLALSEIGIIIHFMKREKVH